MPVDRFRASALMGPVLMLVGLAAVAAAGATVTEESEAADARVTLAEAALRTIASGGDR